MHENRRFAIVITHMGMSKDIIAMPWLETEYRIDESDWIVLSDDGWSAVADGDPAIWDALERKLLVSFFVSQPQLVVVIGHPSDSDQEADLEMRQEQVKQIVRRVRSLLLPTGVTGILADEQGVHRDLVESSGCDEREPAELQATH